MSRDATNGSAPQGDRVMARPTFAPYGVAVEHEPPVFVELESYSLCRPRRLLQAGFAFCPCAVTLWQCQSRSPPIYHLTGGASAPSVQPETGRMGSVISVRDVHLIHLIHRASVLQAVPMNVRMDSLRLRAVAIHSQTLHQLGADERGACSAGGIRIGQVPDRGDDARFPRTWS
jgi:hypothetical protein